MDAKFSQYCMISLFGRFGYQAVLHHPDSSIIIIQKDQSLKMQ